MKKRKTHIEFLKAKKEAQIKCLLSFGEKVRKRGLFFFIFITSLGFSQVQVATDTTQIRIGEQFQYKISVDEIENVIIPKLENLKGFEIIKENPIDTLKNSLIKKYLLTGFDSGSFYIPQQQIFIRNQAFLTDSLLVNVATIPVDTTKVQKFPIKSIKQEPIVFDDYKNYLFWILAIILIVIVVLYFALKKKTDSVAKSVAQLLPPYQEALRSLNLLDKKLLWQSNKIKEYYSELTGIVRHYIERELQVAALEKTTEELIEDLLNLHKEKTIVTETDTIQQLKKLLQESDLVKFAKSKPLALEIENDRKTTEFIINNLQPSTVTETIAIEHINPVTIVQKPAVEKTGVIQKIVIAIGILLLLFLAQRIFLGASKVLENYTNGLKTSTENVE